MPVDKTNVGEAKRRRSLFVLSRVLMICSQVRFRTGTRSI